MKRAVLGIIMVLSTFVVKSQNKNQASLSLSYNQFEIGYERSISEKFWAQTYIDLANQDINAEFDDLLTGIRTGTTVYHNPKNSVDLSLGTGLYFPKNDYYNTTTPYLEIGSKFSRYIGKSNKNIIFLHTVFRYGKTDYKQAYMDNTIFIETVGQFKIPPFYISIGYAVSF